MAHHRLVNESRIRVPAALREVSLRRQRWSMGDLVLSAPEKWQDSPSAPCLGSPDQPQKIQLIARGTSATRRARSDPRRVAPTTRCADRIRNPVPVGPEGRTRPARHQPPPTAAGHRPVRCAAVTSATSRLMTAMESEPAARKRGLAVPAMTAPGREPPDHSCVGDRPVTVVGLPLTSPTTLGLERDTRQSVGGAWAVSQGKL